MAQALKLGCSSLLYGGHLLDTALDEIRDAGYAAVELCCISGMAPHFWPKLTKQALTEIKKKIADRGLVLESVGASGCCGDLEATKTVLGAAAALGAPCVTTATGGKSDDETNFKEIVETWRGYAKAASDAGVRLSVKPHVRSAVYHGPTTLRFLKELDTTWVGVNYDPTHIYRTPSNEDPIATLKQLTPHILTARFRDCAGRELAIGPVEKQVCGEGVLDIKGYFAALKDVPNLKYVTLEIVGAVGLERAQVRNVVDRCAKYVKDNNLI